MFTSIILFVIRILLSILTSLQLHKRQRLSFPSTMEYYIIEKMHLDQQIKISQTSKTMLNLVRRIRNNDFDNLTIVAEEDFELRQRGYAIEAFIGVKTLLKIDRVISIKRDLEFYEINVEYYDVIKEKIDFLRLKCCCEGDHYDKCGFLRFNSCQITKDIFEYFAGSRLCLLSIMNCEIIGFNILHTALVSMPKLHSIIAPWQNNSMEELANLRRINKIKYCNIKEISEICDPALIVKFIENNMNYDGHLSMTFSVPVTLLYRQTVRDLIEEKISSDFIIIRNHNNI